MPSPSGPKRGSKTPSSRRPPASTASRPSPASPRAAAAGRALTAAERASLERQMVADLARSTRASGALVEILDDEPDSQGRIGGGDLADVSSDVIARENASVLANRSHSASKELEDALARLRHSPAEYGICDKCGEHIPFARLEVVPQTRHCRPCAPAGR